MKLSYLSTLPGMCISSITIYIFMFLVVPANPVSAVCPVYDVVNGTLQVIETTWNEVVC